MTKHVVVIASGETERRALPHLLAHFRDRGIDVTVRIPPGNRPLRVSVVYSLIQSLFYDFDGFPPDKYVILVDADGQDPDDILGPLRVELSNRLGSGFGPSVQYAYAQWHLESWYFADAANLRDYIGRALGSVDTSSPDEIQNPKLHLKHLLGDNFYTALISEEIAQSLNAQTISSRSPSFNRFLQEVENGPSPVSLE